MACNDPARGKTVVFGHTPSAFYNGKMPAEIRKAGGFISVNCSAGEPAGRLACLRLDDMKVFYSEGLNAVKSGKAGTAY